MKIVHQRNLIPVVSGSRKLEPVYVYVYDRWLQLFVDIVGKVNTKHWEKRGDRNATRTSNSGGALEAMWKKYTLAEIEQDNIHCTVEESTESN